MNFAFCSIQGLLHALTSPNVTECAQKKREKTRRIAVNVDLFGILRRHSLLWKTKRIASYQFMQYTHHHRRRSIRLFFISASLESPRWSEKGMNKDGWVIVVCACACLLMWWVGYPTRTCPLLVDVKKNVQNGRSDSESGQKNVTFSAAMHVKPPCK